MNGEDASVIFCVWDVEISSDSIQTPMAKMIRTALRRILHSILSEDIIESYEHPLSIHFFLDYVIAEWPMDWLPSSMQSYDELLLASYRDARQTLYTRSGAHMNRCTWGNVRPSTRFKHALFHIDTFREKLKSPEFSEFAGGSGGTANAGGSVSLRLIVDPNDWDRSRVVIALSQSIDPLAPN